MAGVWGGLMALMDPGPRSCQSLGKPGEPESPLPRPTSTKPGEALVPDPLLLLLQDLHQALTSQHVVFLFLPPFFPWFLKAIERFEMEKKAVKEKSRSSPGDRGKTPFSWLRWCFCGV